MEICTRRLTEGEVGAATDEQISVWTAYRAASGSVWALIGHGRLIVALECQSNCSAPVMYGPISLLLSSIGRPPFP